MAVYIYMLQRILKIVLSRGSNQHETKNKKTDSDKFCYLFCFGLQEGIKVFWQTYRSTLRQIYEWNIQNNNKNPQLHFECVKTKQNKKIQKKKISFSLFHFSPHESTQLLTSVNYKNTAYLHFFSSIAQLMPLAESWEKYSLW